MHKRMITIGAVACALALTMAGLSVAQPPAGERGGDRGGDRMMRQFDPAQMAQMRQRMMERMKERLGADDESWKVIEPRLTKVQDLNRQQMMTVGRGMFGLRGPGMRGGPGGDQGGPQTQRFRMPGQEDREPTAVEKAAEALNTTLENPSASADQIKQQLTALRAAREKAKQELAAARQDLRQILTVRQEALLVVDGTLD